MRLGRNLFFFAILIAVTRKQTFGITLAPGDSVAINGTSAVTDPSLHGNIVAQSDTSFDATGFGVKIFSAQLHSAVIREAGGTLDFYYEVVNSNSYQVEPVSSVAISGFAGVAVDANFRSDMTGQYAPSTATRNVGGDIIQFTGYPIIFGQFFPAGASTYSALIKTNASAYTVSGGAVGIQFVDTQDTLGIPPDPASAVLLSFSPNGNAVPEPSTIASFAVGLIVFSAYLTRRLRRS